MIRVLNIQETIKSGGVERRRLSLSKLLDKTKFELRIICTHKGGNIAKDIENEGVSIIEIGTFKGPQHWSQHKKVQKVIDEFKPHIIHGAVFEGVTMAAINGFLKRVPIIIIEETSDPQNRSWKGNLLMKMFSKVSDKVIGVSPAATQYLIEKLNIPSNKVALIDNGIAIPREVAAEEIAQLKNELNIAKNDIVIGSVGRMLHDSQKRFSDLIKAFGILKKKHDGIKLILVGEGREKQNYENLVMELGLKDDVKLVGYQSDMAVFFEMFDVFSLVSINESFGLVLVEAMMKKKPIVATHSGGIKYIVDDGETGFLVKPYQIDQIANKLEELVKNENLRKQFGLAGYRKAIANYTEERYVNQVQTLYSELIKNKKLV